jgi:hypothetical protein
MGAPGATVVVTDESGQELGTATVDSAGKWTLTLPALESGAYPLTVTQTTPDGKQTETPLTVTVAVPEYAPPAVTKPGTEVNVVSGAKLPLEGAGEPGAAVTLSEGGNTLAQAEVDDAGKWALVLPALPEGVHELVVSQTTKEGAESEASKPLIVIVTVPPLALVGAAPVVVQPGKVVRGIAPSGAKIEVYAGKTLVGKAQADKNGEWRLKLPRTLPIRTTTLTIKARDASGAPLGEGVVAITVTAPKTLPVTGGRIRR